MGGWKLAEVLRSALDRIRGCHPEAPLLSTEEAECRAAERFVAEQDKEAFFFEPYGQRKFTWPHYSVRRRDLVGGPVMEHPFPDITVIVDGHPIAYVKAMRFEGGVLVIGQLSTASSCVRKGLGEALVRALQAAVQREYSHLGIEALLIEDCGQGQAGLCHYLGGRTTLPRPWLPLQRPAWVVPGDARLSWEAGHNGGPALGE